MPRLDEYLIEMQNKVDWLTERVRLVEAEIEKMQKETSKPKAKEKTASA